MQEITQSSFRYVIGIDPSGNFDEGSGHTGIAIYDITQDRFVKLLEVDAVNYESQCAYYADLWDQIHQLYNKYQDSFICIEDYLLYKHKAMDQVNSRVPTAQLLGYLKMMFWIEEIPYILEPASAVKTRWSDAVLKANGYVYDNNKVSVFASNSVTEVFQLKAEHCKDAMRHALHGALRYSKGGCNVFEVISY